MERDGWLGSTTLLGLLSPPMREELMTLAEPVHLSAQGWLFHEGDPSDRLYLLVSGRLKIVVEGESGTRLLRSLGPGAAIGELGILAGTPRSASVLAVRDCELLQIDGERFRDLLGRHPEIAIDLATVLARQLQESGGLQTADAPASVFAIESTGGGRGDAFWTEMASAFRELGSTAAIDSSDMEGVPPEGRGRALAELERDHDFVLLRAAGGNPDWEGFCARQADRNVVLTDGAQTIASAPRGSDLVFLGAPEHDDFDRWNRAVQPRAHHVIGSVAELSAGARRITRRLTGRALGLVLSGGGARAFAHIGVLEVLAEEGITFDRVGGTSMGAFVGAMAAEGWSPDRIRGICETEMVRHSPFSDYTLPRHALIRAHRAERMLRRLFGERTLEQLTLPLFTISADMLSARLVIHRTGPLWEAVGASMAIPGLAPPVSHQAQLLIDGGVLNNLPVDIMAADEPGPIVAVDVMRRIEPDELARSARASVPTILETLSRATVLGSVERAETNRALASVVIVPDVQHISLRDFRQLRGAIDAGRAAAEKALADGGKDVLLGLGAAHAVSPTPG
jgi:predicted acylesterase/phospholipase RssA/CRP-like cAMP-binding protein